MLNNKDNKDNKDNDNKNIADQIFTHKLSNFENIRQQIEDLAKKYQNNNKNNNHKNNHEISWQMTISEGLYYEANVREKAPEQLEQSNTQGVSITLYQNGASASVSTANFSAQAIEQTFSKACEIVEWTERDEYAGLANAEDLISTRDIIYSDELELFHPFALNELPKLQETIIEYAQTMQDHVRAQNLIINSEGCGGQYHFGQAYQANSLGFKGFRQSSMYQLWANAVAQNQTLQNSTSQNSTSELNSGMQTDSWMDQKRCFKTLDTPSSIAQTAVEHAREKLNPKSLKTQKTDVVFINYAADELIEYLLDALSGHSQYHQSGFLTAALGKKILPEFIELEESPFLKQGLSSKRYDAAGVAKSNLKIIENGQVASYLLNAYFAKKLKMKNTGHAGGTANLMLRANKAHTIADLPSLLKQMHTGLLVTDIMGPGFNELTGDYSKGASGFWVEAGIIAYPVEGITIAGNILDIYKNIQAIADDALFDSIQTGSIWIKDLTIAGQ